MPGRLVLCPTPIGNLADITLRALEELRAADRVLAEDTRRTAILLRHYDIRCPLESYHDHNEDARAIEVVARLQRGERIALVSDAGSPMLADPGFRLVRAAVVAEIPVTALPGPSALLPALMVAALPMHHFAFLGFPPRAPTARRAAFREALRTGWTTVWYESPRRLASTLRELEELGAGERPAAVVRELSKVHEEVVRGTVASLAARFAAVQPRGELVLVVGDGADALPVPAGWQSALEAVREARGRGLQLPQAVAQAAARFGQDRRALYAAAIEPERDGRGPGARPDDAGPTPSG